MLTYATIAARSGAGGQTLVEYLLQTLSTERADLANYYQRGMRADLAGTLSEDDIAAVVTELVRQGTKLIDLPAALDAAVQEQHASLVGRFMVGETAPFASRAEYVVTSPNPEAATKKLLFRGVDSTDVEAAISAARYRRDKVLERVERGLFGQSTAEPRRDTHPRLTAVPDAVRDAFSKRTKDGTDAAREFAASQGKDWDRMSDKQKVGLVHPSTPARR